jgi:hypothetical protein
MADVPTGFAGADSLERSIHVIRVMAVPPSIALQRPEPSALGDRVIGRMARHRGQLRKGDHHQAHPISTQRQG